MMPDWHCHTCTLGQGYYCDQQWSNRPHPKHCNPHTLSLLSLFDDAAKASTWAMFLALTLPTKPLAEASLNNKAPKDQVTFLHQQPRSLLNSSYILVHLVGSLGFIATSVHLRLGTLYLRYLRFALALASLSLFSIIHCSHHTTHQGRGSHFHYSWSFWIGCISPECLIAFVEWNEI